MFLMNTKTTDKIMILHIRIFVFLDSTQGNKDSQLHGNMLKLWFPLYFFMNDILICSKYVNFATKSNRKF
jgi:hypothetical protein